MMDPMVARLVRLVTSTGRLPGFSHAYRAFYDVVLDRFDACMREHRCVSSVLLKGSFARREHQPGYSDIDLAIVIRDDSDLDEMIEVAKRIHAFKQRLFAFKVPVVGEIEIFKQADAAHPMFQGYSRHFSWRLVSGDPVPFSTAPLEPHEWLWYEFFKFLIFQTISNVDRIDISATRRARRLARLLGVDPIPESHLEIHAANIRKFDELLAPLVDPDAPCPDRFEADHIGPYTPSGPPVVQTYIRFDGDVIPSEAVQARADRSKDVFLLPALIGPNAMRFVTGPFHGPSAGHWANVNLQTIRYQWRGSILNQPFVEDAFDRSSYVDMIRSIHALGRNPLVANRLEDTPEMIPPGTNASEADFRKVFTTLDSVDWPAD